MSKPVANFNFIASGLSVSFEDLSTNVPTTWGWDFGDGDTSISKNPVHTYDAANQYKVILTASNTDGSSTFSYTILVSEDPRMNVTVEKLIEYESPTGLVLDPIELSQNVRKWQIYLQPLVYTPYEVLEADMFNQAKWPTLINILISKLVVYDMIMENARKAMMNSTSSSTGQGNLKSLETGPSKAEWYDASDFWSTMFKGADGIGFIGALTTEICLFAARQNIYLPGICENRVDTPLFIIGKKP